MPRRDQHSQLSRARASFFCGIVATLLVCSLCPVILSGYLQVGEHDRLREKHRDHMARVCMSGGTGARAAVSYANPAFVLQSSTAIRKQVDIRCAAKQR